MNRKRFSEFVNVVQIVKLCVRVLVKLSKEDKLSFKEAEKHKSTAVAVRSMANRLENDLIKASI